MNLIQQIKYAREAGDVQRLHAHRKSGVYNVAQHCYNVATLLKLLHPKPKARLIWACLFHDSAERIVGDIPAVTKNCDWFDKVAIEEVESIIRKDFRLDYELKPDDERWLTALDTLELYFYCLEQAYLGYANLVPVMINCEEYLKNNKETPKVVLDILEEAETDYKEPIDERKYYHGS